MPILTNIVISAFLAVAGAIGVYKYAPLNWLDNPQPPRLGSTITTILGTDRLSDSRAVINTNFSNLNTDKIQSGDTVPLLTITTGTVGTLTLTNKLTVPNGGTASTTLSSNQLLIGKGTSEIGVVSGWGTSGQLLTSGGAGVAPTWVSASFDTTANYILTGNWLFQAKASSTNFGILDQLYVGRTASSTIQGSTSGTSVLQGFLNILGSGVGTSTVTANMQVSGNATTSRLFVDNGPNQGCYGCIGGGYERITASGALNGGTPSTVSITASCTTGKIALSGGYNMTNVTGNCSAQAGVTRNEVASSSTGWLVSWQCDNGRTDTLYAYAYCAYP